jgi:hypothetical protein
MSPSPRSLPLLACLLMAASGVVATAAQSLAQTQTWQRRGAPPPAGSTVVPENCVTGSDGTVTCGTRLEGGTGRPPAAPRLDPFPN